MSAPRGEPVAGEAAPASLPSTAQAQSLGNRARWEKPCCAGALLRTATRGMNPACTGQPDSSRGAAGWRALPRDPVFGVWAAVVVFFMPRFLGR